MIESLFGKVGATEIMNTKSFDIKSARMVPGWLQELQSAGSNHTPETAEYGISSFVYRADRPFHPNRLERILTSGAFPGVLRSKGFAWSASDHVFSAEWSQAGFVTNPQPGVPWLSDNRAEWPPEAERFKDGRHGDRRQELVFIGATMDEKTIRGTLDAALLNDQEFALGPEAWSEWTKLVSVEADEDAEEDAEHDAPKEPPSKVRRFQ